MKKEISIFIKNSDIYTKSILILYILMPLALSMSILIADLFCSIIALITIYLLIKKRDFREYLKKLKKPIYVILLFYLIIILSLVFSYDFKLSFLPSFFYFRYILFAIGISYIFYKSEVASKIVFFSLLFCFILIFFDSIYEYFQIKKMFGLSVEDIRINTELEYKLTSFFVDEKKLGSFLVRLLPFISSLYFFCKLKTNNSNNFIFSYHGWIPLLIVGVLIFFTTERVAMFLFLFFLLCVFRLFKNKLIIFSIILSLLLITLISNKKITYHYINKTLFQLEIIKSSSTKLVFENFNFSNIKYLSEEHEKLIRSGLEIFKEDSLTGSGIKTYHKRCNEIKKNKSLDIVCSSHPHNTYIQILSDVGILGFFVIVFILFYIVYLNFKIFKMKQIPNIYKSFYLLNLGIIMNLMPFIPSGSFFNNWINLMIYFPIGFWFYLFLKVNKNKSRLK